MGILWMLDHYVSPEIGTSMVDNTASIQHGRYVTKIWYQDHINTLLLLAGCMPRSELHALTKAANSRSSSLERQPSQPTSGCDERAITAPLLRCRHTTAGTRRIARNLKYKYYIICFISDYYSFLFAFWYLN